MTSFVALNIEPEEDSEDEIDDSKEIQIEEGLKLYQNAMKLQSQGPAYFEQTRKAYTKLFASEIFAYPESQLDSNHLGSENNDDIIQESMIEASALPASGTDGASSMLHQILYLSQKNYGQFILDQLRHNLPRTEVPVVFKNSAEYKKILTELIESLFYFVQALKRDDTDSELWRLVARICGYVGSKRLARYCFETILDTDGERLRSWPEPLRLDQSFAATQLRLVLQEALDVPSESQLMASSEEQMAVTEFLKKFIDPCHYLPKFRQEILDRDSEQAQSKLSAEPQEIYVAMRTWASCGQSLMFRFTQEAKAIPRVPPGARYYLTLAPRQTLNTEESNPDLHTKDLSPSVDQILMPGLPAPEYSAPQDWAISDATYATELAPIAIAENEEAQEDESSKTLGDDEANDPVDPLPNEAGESRRDEHGLETQDPTDSKDNNLQNNIETAVKSGEKISLPSRKRSSDDAEIHEKDNIDTGRSRSKRIKARGSITETHSAKELLAEEKNRHHSDQLQAYRQLDNSLFEAVAGSLSKFNVDSLGSLSSQKEFALKPQDISSNNATPNNSSETLAHELGNHLAQWGIEQSNAFLAADTLETNSHGSALAMFLEHSKRGYEATTKTTDFPMDEELEAFAEDIRLNWTYLDQLALKWIEALLSSRQRVEEDKYMVPSTYEEIIWPESLKTTVAQMLVMKDEFIYIDISNRIKDLDQRLLKARNQDRPYRLQSSEENLIKVAQSIFELHIDIFNTITGPNSGEDVQTRQLQLDRLGRWAALASDAISKKPDLDKADGPLDPLAIRFLWSSVLYANLVDPAARDHIVLCFQDLKKMLEGAENSTIKLPNNAVMPEISAEQADREISILTTMEFFLSVFSLEQNNLLSVVENLEPILERSIQWQDEGIAHRVTTDEMDNENSVKTNHQNQSSSQSLLGSSLDTQKLQVILFLDRASISLKHFLWQKLRFAYEAIDYPPRVLSCNLRSIEIIMNHLKSESYISGSANKHQLDLLSWIRRLGGHTENALKLVLNVPNAFETIDEAHLHSSMNAMASLQRILWVQSHWDDSVRVGSAQSLRPSNQQSAIFDKSADILRATLVSAWMLQYTLLKESFEQNPQLSKSPNEDLLKYLKLLHQALGPRNYCAIGDKIFLKYMKSELLRLAPTESSGNDMAQIVYDLYGLKIAQNIADLESHKCPSVPLDRETAFEIMDLVMAQVSKMNIRDLGKSELRATIDKMQQAIKTPKATPNMLFNRRTINNFLRSPINPIDLYRSLQGIGAVGGWSVYGTTIGDKGWYFLLGHLSLAKFRSQKRTSAGPIDDLELASNFLRQDLELGSEKWETWYRLAQVFDTRIDEDVGWTADKLNNHMGDLRILQRNSIHCYTMAVATAIRSADPSFETVEKISDLYVDFALRIYASSREPFSMQVFSLRDFVKLYNGETRGMYEGKPFRELQMYSAWKFVCALLRRALVHKSEYWMVHYMLGKCLWKMYKCREETRGRAPQISHIEIIEAFKRAIELLPERRDSRHPEKDPTLEPHYKLVSIVHKLVQLRRILPEEGCKYLDVTSYSRKIPPVHDLEEWEGYLLHVLKALRSADRSNWHHRMVARAAHTIYDNSPTDIIAALGAKHELTQQIFTKTMHTQIWRPDNERPGRHFVYTSRYVGFFVRLLLQLKDRASLEILAKRIRKRPGDFFNHTGIWEEICTAYLKLLRRHGTILDGNEDLVFKTLPHATFLLNSDRLETWAHSPTNASPILDLLREVVELKKLNSNLMKSAPIEDLVGDTYAHLYEMVVPELVVKSNTEENRVRMRVDQLLMNTSTTAPDGPPAEPPTKPSRPKSVGRREIQRKAEALVSKTPPPSAIVSSRPSLGTNTKILTAVAIPEREPEQAKSGALLAVQEIEDTAKDVSSVPGSLHDSADDESELSEIEDAIEDAPDEAEAEAEGDTERDAEAAGDRDGAVKVLFPNLSGRAASADENDEGSEDAAGDEPDRDAEREGMDGEGD